MVSVVSMFTAERNGQKLDIIQMSNSWTDNLTMDYWHS